HTLASSGYPIDRRETAVVGGAVSLGDRLIVDARLPLEHQVGPRLEGFGDAAPLERFALGDLAIGARLHVADGGPVAVFVRGEVTLPSGDDHDFAGDAGWGAEGLGIARVELPHAIVIAGTGGFHIRSKEVQIAENVLGGDELVWGVGATVGIP